MEDNSSSDDEIKESPIEPRSSGKKVKLNDGSSQDSFKETVTNNTDENVDSGVSADKSESISGEDRQAGTIDGPSNEVVIAAPSTSNVRAILLNIRRPKRNRNYRKRKTPDRDSDSNDSSQDSDDLSTADSQLGRRNEVSNSDTDSDDIQRLIDLCGTESSSSNSGSITSSDSNIYESDGLGQLPSGDTDSDENTHWMRSNDEAEDNVEMEENNTKPPNVVLKPRPKHNYMIVREIIHREMGLTFPCGKTAKEDVMFEQNFYSSLHCVYRLKKLHQLHKHKGCVNSINFHPEGKLLASGSDDTNVVVWDWARKMPLQTIKTGHKSNVFQSKFLYLNSRSQLNIVTCARDGQVRLVQCPASGGSASRRRLMGHARAAHKLHVCPHEPHRVLSAGEDGLVLQCDLRHDAVSRLFQVKERNSPVPLYSVAGHPLEARQLAVAGRDKFVRVFDTRKPSKPLALYCPATFTDTNSTTRKRMRLSMMHLTCAVYNHDGTEILGSYNDEDIYLFNAKNDIYDKDNASSEIKDGYTHRYNGHRNNATFKGVSFFGPNSEYIVSGSDCSYIYVWEKKSEAIVQWLQGDANGVVNCIEPHPRFPVLATSGLDKDVKIWIPHGQKDPKFDGLEKKMRDNSRLRLRAPLFNDFLPTLYSAWRDVGRSDDREHDPDSDANICTAF